MIKMKKIFVVTVQLLMLRIPFKQIPVKALCLIPLCRLSKILPHKQQLLTRMHHHQAICCPEITELIRHVSRHLVNHGLLQMHNFIMGQNKHVVLAVSIHKTECNLILMIFSENRITFHILKKIMHPTHVPLVSKSQAIICHVTGHLRPCG